MSWAAHDLEPYVIQKHLGRKVAFMPLLAGSYAPDILTKWFVYGVGAFGFEAKASNPAQFHRGWPGVGFTHSLVFGVVLALIIYRVWGNPVVAYSFLIGPMTRVSARSTRRVLPFESGDTTQALLEFQNGATATIATSLKTPGFVWRLAVYGSEMWAESLSETKVRICRKDGSPETFDVPQTNHIGANLDSFAAAALGQGKFQIDDAGIIHTVAALAAVFDSAERNGAWRDIA